MIIPETPVNSEIGVSSCDYYQGEKHENDIDILPMLLHMQRDENVHRQHASQGLITAQGPPRHPGAKIPYRKSSQQGSKWWRDLSGSKQSGEPPRELCQKGSTA